MPRAADGGAQSGGEQRLRSAQAPASDSQASSRSISDAPALQARVPAPWGPRAIESQQVARAPWLLHNKEGGGGG
eukprot:1687778-Pyramimonas_sp.AAC.1